MLPATPDCSPLFVSAASSRQGANVYRSTCTPLATAASFEVNSEPHTGARPSVRLCVGPELARCVHILEELTELPNLREYYKKIKAIIIASFTNATQNVLL